MIGYLVIVLRFPEQFKRLFNAIYDADNQYLIHIDANSGDGLEADIRDFIRPFPNAEILEGKGVLWGGYSLVDAELRGMEQLLKMGAWEFFINLSGQDFPLLPQAEIIDFLRSNVGTEFIRVSDQEAIRPDTMSRVQSITLEHSDKLVDTGKRRSFPAGMKPYIGNQWMIVSRGFCESVCNDPEMDGLKVFYRNTFIPDEGFFQTAIMNGAAHGTIVSDDLRSIDWVPDGVIKLRPRTYVLADGPTLLESGNLFARKFDMDLDEDIILFLEDSILLSTGGLQVEVLAAE